MWKRILALVVVVALLASLSVGAMIPESGDEPITVTTNDTADNESTASNETDQASVVPSSSPSGRLLLAG